MVTAMSRPLPKNSSGSFHASLTARVISALAGSSTSRPHPLLHLASFTVSPVFTARGEKERERESFFFLY